MPPLEEEQALLGVEQERVNLAYPDYREPGPSLEFLRTTDYQRIKLPADDRQRVFYAKTEQPRHDAGIGTAALVLSSGTAVRLSAFEMIDGQIFCIDDPAVIQAIASHLGIEGERLGGAHEIERTRRDVPLLAKRALEDLPPLRHFLRLVNLHAFRMQVYGKTHPHPFSIVHLTTNAGLEQALPEGLARLSQQFGGQFFSEVTFEPEAGYSPNGTRLYVLREIPNGPEFLIQLLRALKEEPRQMRALQESFSREAIDEAIRFLSEQDKGHPAAIRCFRDHRLSKDRQKTPMHHLPPDVLPSPHYGGEWETMIGLQDQCAQGIYAPGLTRMC